MKKQIKNLLEILGYAGGITWSLMIMVILFKSGDGFIQVGEPNLLIKGLEILSCIYSSIFLFKVAIFGTKK